MRSWLTLLLVALFVVACTPEKSVVPLTSAPTTTLVSTTLGPDSDQDLDVCVSGELPFKADGLVAAVGESEGDATRIAQIRWEARPTCERIIISFETDSASPATMLGVTGVSVIGFAGVVRVDLPATIVHTAVADMRTDGALSGRTYVVRDDTGRLVIDIHAPSGTAVAARAFTTRSPATLVIDLVPQPELTAPVGTTISDTAVIITPPSGPTLYPFKIEAYAKPSLLSARVQLTSNDVVVVDRAVALPGDNDAWQALNAAVGDGPSGPTRLFVGTVDVNDNQVDGAIVLIDLP